jgi:ClpP class serine protease
MSHELLRLKDKILKTPQLITPDSFDNIINYIDERNGIDFEVKERDEAQLAKDSNSPFSYNTRYNKEKKLGLIEMEGALSYKPISFMGMDCGGASYSQIKSDFEALADSGAKTVAFLLDTPGGEAYQCFQSARYVREMADANDIKLIGYVDSLAASAGYAWACVMDEVIMAEGASVGSIGVVIKLTNVNEAKKKAGVTDTYIYAGDEKIPFNKDGEFKESFLQELQDDVDDLYTDFVEHVATARGITSKEVIATKAKTFTHKTAIEMGLADSVMNPETFYAYLEDVASQQRQMGTKLKPTKNLKTEEVEMTLEEMEALQTQLSEAQAVNAALVAEKDGAVEALASLTASFADQSTKITEMVAQLADLQKVQAEAKVVSRKEKLTAVLAADQVDTMLASLEALSDDSFDTVVAGFKGKVATKEKSDLFVEQGGEGAALESKFDSLADTSGDITDNLIAEKYTKTK